MRHPWSQHIQSSDCLYMSQLLVLGKLRYTWCPNFKVVLLMILVCQVNYYNIGSTLHKYECWEIDICRDICDICFYKKGALKLSKMLQLAWNFFWLDKIKIYCHLSFFNFSVRQVWNWYLLRYLPYLYLQGGCCKIVQNNQICVKFFLRGNYKILLTPLFLQLCPQAFITQASTGNTQKAIEKHNFALICWKLLI